MMEPNTERMVNEFKELVSIDSESGDEREIADVVKQKLIDLGAEVYEDDTQSITGSSAGNLFARFKAVRNGEAGDGSALLFSAHLDTVKPGIGKTAVVGEDGRITSKGDTVLGADDLSGVVDILEGIRMVQESGVDHGEIEVLITVMEEAYAVGAKAFDCSGVSSKECYVLDISLDVGQAVVKAPTLISFTVTVHGKAIHAGFKPEAGIHAIQIAAKAVSRLDIGRIADDTTFNIGTIEGGNGSNIVPDLCVLTGETRSYDHEKALAVIDELKRVFTEEAEAAGGSAEVEAVVRIHAYHTPEDAPVCRRFEEACRSADVAEPEQRYHAVFGGSDNNQLVEKGLSGIVLGTGMWGCHTVEEYIYVDEMEAGARLVAELIAGTK